MPYDERTLCELSESAEITPIGIQLEVNAEIFNTLHNLLCTMREDKDISPSDEARLYKLWRHDYAKQVKKSGLLSGGLGFTIGTGCDNVFLVSPHIYSRRSRHRHFSFSP